MAKEELWRLTARETAARIRGGKMTAETYVRACLERIDGREADVGAWIHLDPKRVIAEARARDGEKPRGLLHGVPVGFKDIVETAGMPTGYGSRAYPNHVPPSDAACVALVRAAGGIVMGKTVSTEFAVRQPGSTANPHDRRRTPGGSSSGSAAAVADGMVPLATGTQTAGSTIRPAAYCGIHALKPSYGIVSLAGVKCLSATYDTMGLLARSLDDLLLFRDVLMGFSVSKPLKAEKPRRVAFCRTPYWDRADEATHAHLEAAAKALSRAGAKVQELRLPKSFGTAEEVVWDVIFFELARNFATDDLDRHEGLSLWLRGAIKRGRGIELSDHFATLAKADKMARELRGLVQPFDFVLAPAAPGEAPMGLGNTGPATFNALWHIAGLPAINVPAFTGPNGLPIGAQLVGPYLADDRLLAAAAWAETRLG